MKKKYFDLEDHFYIETLYGYLVMSINNEM